MSNRLNLAHYLAARRGTSAQGEAYVNVCFWHPTIKGASAAGMGNTRDIPIDTVEALGALLAEAVKTGQAAALAERFATVAAEVRTARKALPARAKDTSKPASVKVSPFAAGATPEPTAPAKPPKPVTHRAPRKPARLTGTPAQAGL